MKSNRRSFFALLAAPFIAGAALVFAKKTEAKPWDKPLPFDPRVSAVLRSARYQLQQQDVQPFKDGSDTSDITFYCLGSKIGIGVSLAGCKEVTWNPIARATLEVKGLIYVWGKSKCVVMNYPVENSELVFTPVRIFDIVPLVP